MKLQTECSRDVDRDFFLKTSTQYSVTEEPIQQIASIYTYIYKVVCNAIGKFVLRYLIYDVRPLPAPG